MNLSFRQIACGAGLTLLFALALVVNCGRAG